VSADIVAPKAKNADATRTREGRHGGTGHSEYSAVTQRVFAALQRMVCITREVF
jgi:hypothetical protein